MKTKTNKKFLSLILAISMTLTSFAGLTITTASAEGEPAYSDWTLTKISESDISHWTAQTDNTQYQSTPIVLTNADDTDDWTIHNSRGDLTQIGVKEVDGANALYLTYTNTYAQYNKKKDSGYFYYQYTIRTASGDRTQTIKINGSTADSVSLEIASKATEQTFTTVIDATNQKAYTYNPSNTLVNTTDLSDIGTVNGIKFQGQSDTSAEMYVKSVIFGTAVKRVIPDAPEYSSLNLTKVYSMSDDTDLTALDSHNWSAGRTATSTTGTLAAVGSITRTSDNLSFVYNRYVKYNNSATDGLYYFKYKVRMYNLTAENQNVKLVGSNSEYNIVSSTAKESGEDNYDYITVVDTANSVAYTYNYNGTYLLTTDFNGDTITGIKFENVVDSNSKNTFQIYTFEYGTITDAPTQADDPTGLSIDYEHETINTTAALEYSTDNKETWTACTANMAVTAFDWDGTAEKTVYFRTAASGDTLASAGNAYVTIPVRPSAPTVTTDYVITNAPVGSTEGNVKAADAEKNLEYSMDNGTNWTDLDTTGATVEAGSSVLARVKHSDSAFASASATATVKQTYSITYNANGGSAVTAGEYIDGGDVVAFPTTSTKDGYTFEGWYKEEGLLTKVTDTTGLTENLTLYAKWTANSQTINKTTPQHGTFTVASSADTDSVVAITAITPDQYYELDTITVTKTASGDAIDVTNENKFTMPAEAVTVTVTFKAINYTVTATVNTGVKSVTLTGTNSNSQTKTVEGSETTLTFSVPHDTYTISATYETGYEKDSFSVDSIEPTDNAGTFTISAKVSADPEITGTVEISGTAKVGETLTANATITNGSGDISYQWQAKDEGAADTTYQNIGTASTTNTYTIDKAYAGKVIRVVVTRGGTSGSKESAATDAVAPKTYTVTATISAGNIASITLTSEDESITYTKTLSPTVSDNTYTATDTSITFSVVEGTYTVSATPVSGNKITSNLSDTVTVDDEHTTGAFTITARAIADIAVTITTDPSDVGGITVTDGTKQITATTADAYKEDATITAEATAVDGYDVVLQYKVGGGNFETYSTGIKLGTDDVEFKATYSKKTFAVTKGTETNGTFSITGADNLSAVPWGTVLTVNATPATGYSVGTITATGAEVEGNTFAMPKAATTVNVTFTAKSYSLTNGKPQSASEANNGYITLSKDLGITYNEEITVTVTPNENYELDGKITVTGVDAANITVVEAGKTYKFKMPDISDVTVSAAFKAKIYDDPQDGFPYWADLKGISELDAVTNTEGNKFDSYTEATLKSDHNWTFDGTYTIDSTNHVLRANPLNGYAQYNQAGDEKPFYYRYKIRGYDKTGANTNTVSLVYTDDSVVQIVSNLDITEAAAYEFKTVISGNNAYTYSYDGTYVKTTRLANDKKVKAIRFSCTAQSGGLFVYEFGFGVQNGDIRQPLPEEGLDSWLPLPNGVTYIADMVNDDKAQLTTDNWTYSSRTTVNNRDDYEMKNSSGANANLKLTYTGYGQYLQTGKDKPFYYEYTVSMNAPYDDSEDTQFVYFVDNSGKEYKLLAESDVKSSSWSDKKKYTTVVDPTGDKVATYTYDSAGTLVKTVELDAGKTVNSIKFANTDNKNTYAVSVFAFKFGAEAEDAVVNTVSVLPTATPETTAMPTNTPEATTVPTNTPEGTLAPTNTPEATTVPTNTPEETTAPTNTPGATDAPKADKPEDGVSYWDKSSATYTEPFDETSATELIDKNWTLSRADGNSFTMRNNPALSFNYNRWAKYSQDDNSDVFYYTYTIQMYNETEGTQAVKLAGEKEYTVLTNADAAETTTYTTVVDNKNHKAYTYDNNGALKETTTFADDTITGIKFENLANEKDNNNFYIYEFSYGKITNSAPAETTAPTGTPEATTVPTGSPEASASPSVSPIPTGVPEATVQPTKAPTSDGESYWTKKAPAEYYTDYSDWGTDDKGKIATNTGNWTLWNNNRSDGAHLGLRNDNATGNEPVLMITWQGYATYTDHTINTPFYYTYDTAMYDTTGDNNVIMLEGLANGTIITSPAGDTGLHRYTTVVDVPNNKVYTYRNGEKVDERAIPDGEGVTGITFKSAGENKAIWVNTFEYGIIDDGGIYIEPTPTPGPTATPEPTGTPEPTPTPEPTTQPAGSSSKLSDWDLTDPTATEEFDGKSITKLQEDDWKFGNTNAGANFNEKHVIINGSGELEVNWYGTATYGKTDEENSYYYTYTVKTKDTTGIRSVNLSGVDNSTMLVSGKEITSSDRTFTTVVDVNSKKAYTYDNATGDFVSVVDVPNPAAVKGITFSGGTENVSVGMQVDNVSYGLVNVTPPEKPVTIVLKGDKVNDGEALENGQTYDVTGEKFTETVIKLDEPYTVKDDKTLLFMTNSIVITPPSNANGNIVVDGTKITALEALTAGTYDISITVTSSYKGKEYGSENYTIQFVKPKVTDEEIAEEYEPVITTETVDGKEVAVNTSSEDSTPTEVYNDLVLPTETSFADITWTSDTPSVISNNGAIVKRPLEDKTVTLTAIIANKYNSGSTVSKQITVTVKGVGSMLDDAISKATAIVSADTDETVDLTDLHEDIKIYTKYENDAYPEANEVTLEWSSDNDVLRINGSTAEIYPTTTNEYKVKLTVKATALGAEKTKDIDVTVHLTKANAGDKYAVRCDDLVASNFSEVANLSGDIVSSNISVPTEGLFGSTISWTSSVPMYMSNTGKYTAPSSNTNVTMTGIVSKGKVISDKKHAYSFTVKGKSNNQSGGSGGGGGSSSGGSSSSYSLPMNTGTTTPTTNNQPSNAGNYNPNANTEPEGFTDLGNVAWAEEAINALADKGIISGRSEHIFDPDANITRAEFATIIVKAFGFEDENASVDEFTDVNADDWYYSFVAAAYNNGIISGYDNGSFGSYDNITRQDMAVIIYRAANATGVELDEINEGKTFDDEASIAAYAADAVDALVKAGVINGMTDTEFAPTANATRAQAAKMTYELVK